MQGQGTVAAGTAQPGVHSRQTQPASTAAWEGDADIPDQQDAAELRSLKDQLWQLGYPDSSKLADILTFFAALKAAAGGRHPARSIDAA